MISNFFTPYSTTIICLSLLQIWCQVPRVISAFNCTQVGYFPHSQDPSKFYDCRSNSGPAAVYSCPNEHIYNASLKLCVPSVTTSITTTIALSTTTQKTPTTPVTKAVTTSITTTIALSTTTQKTPTTPVTKVPSRGRGHGRGRGRGHKCFSKKLKEKIQCFKNESRSWKNHLISVSSSNDTKDILEKSLNNTDGIFSAFENERNSSQWFNPFDVLKILDDIGRDVANKSGNTTVTAFSDDIFIEITPLRLPYRFPNYSHNVFGLEQFRDVRDVIEFPKGLFSNSIAYHAVSALYIGLTDMLPTRVFQSNKSYEINSHVISSLIFPNVSTPFKKNIMIILEHLRPLERGDYSVCAYWDYSLRTNQGDGAWSRERCHVMTGRSNKTHTTCSCNHLTNFAILMGSENIPITKTHEFVLSVITYIGCALSLFGSVAAIAILVVLTRGLHSDRNIIHANLLISIAISQTVFLAGVEQTQDRTRCKFTAIMLHYFYLVSFAWMLCEGFHLYAMVIKVFNLTSRVYHYVAFAWGIPAFIVLITAVCRFKEYGTPSSCWISTEYYTLLAFILPVAITLLINIVILCLVMREICKLHVSESSHIKKMINSTFKTVAVLFPLLGITWIFGLLLFVTQQIMFQYLFAVFNSLQGFFIFVLHCLFNSEIRKNFKRKKEVWKSLRAFENVRRRIAISIIPVRSPVTKATTASNERAETFEKSS